MNKYILVDMFWWTGTSKRRGIGVYLTALFTKYFDWGSAIPLWLLPRKLNPVELKEFKSTFRNGDIATSTIDNNILLTSTNLVIPTNNILYAISGSPFERPWSLLNDVKKLKSKHIKLQVVVHDLLPIVFKNQILHQWSQHDQEIYEGQLAQLAEVDHIFATGTSSCKQILTYFPSYVDKLSIIPFGEHNAWLRAPEGIENLPPLISEPYILTISGGEWRKNLVGTLQFFSLKFPKDWKLVVVCKLGRIEKIRLQLLTVEYGVHKRVIWTGEISEDIKWRYLSYAKALLSLSYGEGLNLPVLEAKSVEVPSILLSDLKWIYNVPLSVLPASISAKN